MDCRFCNRDINSINQDNMSPICEIAICEDCIPRVSEKEIYCPNCDRVDCCICRIKTGRGKIEYGREFYDE